jgi:hypothetical protein
LDPRQQLLCLVLERLAIVAFLTHISAINNMFSVLKAPVKFTQKQLNINSFWYKYITFITKQWLSVEVVYMKLVLESGIEAVPSKGFRDLILAAKYIRGREAAIFMTSRPINVPSMPLCRVLDSSYCAIHTQSLQRNLKCYIRNQILYLVYLMFGRQKKLP